MSEGMEEKFSERYPASANLLRVANKSQAIGEFLEWIQGEKNWVLVEPQGKSDEWVGIRYVPCMFRIDDLLAEFFEIDLEAVEKEKQAMLDEANERLVNEARGQEEKGA